MDAVLGAIPILEQSTLIPAHPLDIFNCDDEAARVLVEGIDDCCMNGI